MNVLISEVCQSVCSLRLALCESAIICWTRGGRRYQKCTHHPEEDRERSRADSSCYMCLRDTGVWCGGALACFFSSPVQQVSSFITFTTQREHSPSSLFIDEHRRVPLLIGKYGFSPWTIFKSELIVTGSFFFLSFFCVRRCRACVCCTSLIKQRCCCAPWSRECRRPPDGPQTAPRRLGLQSKHTTVQ